MEFVKKITKCFVATINSNIYDMQFGVETELKEERWSFTFDDLEPLIKFNCLRCDTQLQINRFSLFEPVLGIDPYEDTPEKFVEFIKFIAKKLELKLTTNGEDICYAEASRLDAQYGSKTYIPNIYNTKCPHCGSQYLMFYKFYGGGQDRCPVTLTIDSIWQVRLDEDFAQKYLTVER